MSILDTLAHRFGYQKSYGPLPGWLSATAEASKFSIPDGAHYAAQAEFFQKLSWIHMAVSILASSCAAVKFTVSDGEDDIPDHPFIDLLRHPNPMQSRLEFLEATFAYRALTGNAYWWLSRTSENAPPDELWVIPSNQIVPVPDGKLYLKGYLYDPGDGRQIPLEPWEVVHFKKFHPLNRYVGLSPIEAASIVATGDLQMQRWNAKFFGESNAKLPSVLAFADFIPDDEWERLKKEARDRSQSREMMMLRNVGKGGVEWIRAAASQKDMEFLAGRKASRDELLTLFAPGLASMIDVNATEANAVAGKETFIEFSLWPALSAVAEKATNDVLPAYGEGQVGEFDDIRMTNRVADLAEQAEYAKTHTIDEIRAEYFGDKPLGDERGLMLPAEITKPVPAPAPIEAPAEVMASMEAPRAEVVAAELTEDESKELTAWEKFTIKWLGQEMVNGKPDRTFRPRVLRASVRERVSAGLKIAKDKAEVRSVFARERAAVDDVNPLIEALLEVTKALREAA